MLWLLQLIAYQLIQINQTTPCFLNFTAGIDMWQNCGAGEDWLTWMLLPWEWITGGYFSFMIVSVFIGITYIKYHKVIYPILIGVMFLPISYFLFPDTFFSFAVIMTFVAVGILIWYIYVKQTKEY